MFKKRFLTYFLLALTATFSHGQQHYNTKDLDLVELVGKTIKENHIDYDIIEPHVPVRFVEMLFEQLDPERKYLITSDTAKIRALFDSKDFRMQSFYFRPKLEALRGIFRDRLVAADKLLRELPTLNFFVQDSVHFSLLDDAPFAKDKYELAHYWTRSIKLELLFRYHEDSILKDMTSSSINTYLNENSENAINAELCRIESLLKDEELTKFILNACLNAYCQSFDPHSSFLTIEEEKNFMNSLSSEYFGAGITYVLMGSQYKVAQVSPFSSASNHFDIREGDEITGIFVQGERIDLSCISPEILNGYFYGEAEKTLHVELKSVQDWQYRQFVLEKMSVKNNQNHTYSFLLKDSLTQVGYINFPSFYSPMTIDGRSSAEDMALILMELRKHPLDGLIIDLRNNGGGSLDEANDLIGYFTEYGPLFMAVTKENPEGQLIKDSKKGSLSIGKVVFLVNSLSASASELVVAAMQFYPNSLVVGAPTYGKATGQEVIPLQLKLNPDPQGSVIVTKLKCYRINGTNYQGVGVVPDIELPSIFSKDWIGESVLHFPLKHKRINKTFRPLVPRYEPIDTLQLIVNERNSLSEIDSLSKNLNHLFLKSKGVSIHFNSFNNVFGELSKYEFETTSVFEVEAIEVNEAFMEESKRISQSKLKDPILAETFRIVKDWVNITNQQ